MANPNVQENYSNAGATDPDSKTTSTNVVESRGEFINKDTAKNRREAARQYELLWLEEVSKPPNAALGQTSYTNGRSNKIRLVSTVVASPTSDEANNTGMDMVEFNLSPEISESKQVIYAEIGDIRQAASILIYAGSPSRKWSINAKFLSRTMEEAANTWLSVQRLRSWTNPDTNYKYGYDTGGEDVGLPQVLKLYGYGRTWQGIPVVISSLNVDYPSDIDYIPTAYGTNVPVIQSVTFQLTEARTVDDLLKRFDLEKFKLGVLPEW